MSQQIQIYNQRATEIKINKYKPNSTKHKRPYQNTQTNHPIRPVVNWKNVPLYKTTELFTDILSQYVILPSAYNIKNTPQLTTDLKSIEINPNCRLASFDRSNMYTNVTTEHLKHIIENGLNNNMIGTQHIQEILTIYDLIVK
jgi:hypothetical protein